MGSSQEGATAPRVSGSSGHSGRSLCQGCCSQQIDANPLVSAAELALPWQAQGDRLGRIVAGQQG